MLKSYLSRELFEAHATLFCTIPLWTKLNMSMSANKLIPLQLREHQLHLRLKPEAL